MSTVPAPNNIDIKIIGSGPGSFLFGPFFGKLVKVGIEKFEDEVKLLSQKRQDEKNKS